MPQKTLVEVVNLTMVIEQEMPMKRKGQMVRHHQDFDSDEFEFDYDDENYQKTRRLRRKMKFETYQRGIYCQNCYNEGHYSKECKLLQKLRHICKCNDHHSHHCPSMSRNGRCPLCTNSSGTHRNTYVMTTKLHDDK